jgi:hypothetical protein
MHASPTTKLEQIHELQENRKDETEFNIEQEEMQCSHKTLRTMKTIIGEEIYHYRFLLEKSDKISKRASIAQFNRRQARTAYFSCYVPLLNTVWQQHH